MFSFKKSNTKPEVPVIKHLTPKASTAFHIGDALVLADGVLTPATGATVPEYIAIKDYSAPATDAELLPAYLVIQGHEYETTLATDATTLVAGGKVNIHTDAAQVVVPTSGGALTVVDVNGDGKAGTKVTVRF